VTQLTQTKALLKELIAFPTVSTDSNLELIQWIADQLTSVGASVEVYIDPTGTKANLFATIGPNIDGGIVLSGHSDVVPVADQNWTHDPFDMVEKDGKLFGRGSCDMKGFIAATLAMAPKFAAAPLKRPIHFAFTHDEETGCIGGRALIRELTERGVKPSIAIIGEPTDMRVIEGHKGCFEYTTSFTGLEGHSSAPSQGVNAAEYATRYVSHLIGLREELRARAPSGSRFEPPETTVSIGGIHGGVAHNVIVELQSYVDKNLLPAMQAVHPAASIDVHTHGEVLGLTPMDNNAARELVAELTGANGADVVSFGTEAGLFQSIDMDAVVCGPGSIAQAHKPDEYVAIEQLEQCLQMLERLQARCCVS